MTVKAILEAALTLPATARARLVGQLLESLEEPLREEAMRTGAKLAEKRLRRLLAGKTKGVSEAEAHRRLFGKN
jgi:hypothetical protein